MAMIDGLLQELEQEAQTTKRVLERVPEAHLGWKPHQKSMTLGQLAMHVAIVPGGVAEAAAQQGWTTTRSWRHGGFSTAIQRFWRCRAWPFCDRSC